MKIPTDCAENLAVTMCGGRLKPHVVEGGCDTIRFEGIEDATVNQGVGIDLRDGITAYDGDGNEIEYEVEPSELAPCEVGEFDIEYKASGKGLSMKPTICGRNKVHAIDCGLDTVVEHRLITVTQADPPTISGVGETVIGENTDFDPLDGVSAVDDNGNVLEVEYSGKYLQEANGGIASFESEYEDPLHSLKVSLEPIQPCTPWMGSEEYNNPYLMQAMPTISEAYNTEMLKKIVGGTVAWNQYVKPRTTVNFGIRATQDADGVITLSGTALNTYSNFCEDVPKVADHKYLVTWTVLANPNNLPIKPNANTGMRARFFYENWGILIGSNDTGTVANFGAYQMTSGADYTGVKLKINFHDITQMFGTAIADYIYNLNSDGIAFFKSLFPNDYYPYNSGELLSVQTSAHVTKDGNGQQIASYPLDSSLTLRGIPKLDAQNNLYYDGDVYEPDGTVTRKYTLRDLGTLTWITTPSGRHTAVPPNAKNVDNSVVGNILANGYVATSGYSIANIDKSIAHVNGVSIIINDSALNGADATAFKTAMSGVYLVYELATPTTESAEPYTSQQSADPSGTEEFVSANVVPVGHVSSYARVCPISGHDSVKVTRAGKNLLNPKLYSGVGYNTAVGTKWTPTESAEQFENPSEGIYTIFFPNSWMQRAMICEIPTSDDYHISISRSSSGTGGASWGWLDEDYTVLSTLNNTEASQTLDTSLLSRPSGAKYFYFLITNRGGSNVTITVTRPQIELGSTATAYEPYAGQTYTTALGQTVYGGTLDVVSGELVVDRGMVDLGDATWNYTSTYSCWVTSAIANVVKKYPTQAEMITAIAEKYVVDPVGILNGANFTAGKFILGTSGNLFVKTGSDSETPTGAFVYELATPQTIQLTPTEVRTLLGTNNVWSDGIYHPLVKRYLKDNSWVGRYINGVMYYVNNGYGYLHTDTFKDAFVDCSHFAVKKFVPKPTDTSTPLADNALYLTDDGSLYVRYDAIEDEDPTVSLQNWIDFVTDNNVFMTVPSYSDTASDSLDLTLQYNAPIPQGEAYKYIAQGTYTVTYRAVDQCGNETEVTRNITVGENIPVRRTVLRQDGTLVINELASEYYANNEIYGAITHEYEPYDENNRYIFSSNNDIPWYAEQNSITGVVIGEDIYPTSINMWFYNLQNAETWELARLHTENTTSMIRTFAHSDVTNLHLDELDTSNVTTMEYMFFTAKSSQPFVALLDTSSCENFNSMFSNGASSAFTQIDVSSFDVSNAKSMVGMFFRCDRLTELDLSNFIPTACEDFSNMFSNCTNLEHLNLLNFHTPSAINMEGMFSQCKQLEELDLSAFDTSNVVNMSGVFAGTIVHDAVDFTGFDTSNVDNFTAMFAQASVGGDEHYLDLSTWDTSNAVNMNQMFVTASIGILNIANFTTPNVTNVNLMFANSSSQMLQTIYCNNDFDLTNVGSNVQMFGNNPNLVGGNGTTYDASRTTSEYARLDNPPSAPGYFTVAPDSDITNEEDIEITNEDDEPITT